MPVLRRRRNPEGRMSLGDHLRELRRRVLIAAVALVAGSVVGWIFYPQVYQHLTAPLLDLGRARHNEAMINVNFAGVTSAFSQQLTISLFVGVILSCPIWLYQVWAFIVPGLTTKEKRISLAFIAASVPLFLAGCWFAYITLPKAIAILLSFTPAGAVNLPEASMYFSFVTRFILVFGLAFLLPVFLVALNVVHVLPGRVMLGAWRPAVFLIFVFAAVVTPTPDPYTMLLLAVPLSLLYFAACGISLLIDRRRLAAQPSWIGTADDEASPL